VIVRGRSDKPVEFKDYTHLRYVHRVEEFIEDLKPHNTTVVVPDWGSLIGLRVVGDHPDWFARVVIANGTLPVLPQGYKHITVPNPPLPNPTLTLPIQDGVPSDQSSPGGMGHVRPHRDPPEGQRGRQPADGASAATRPARLV